MKIILASKSPRRQELLRAIGIENFIIRPSDHEAEAAPDLPPDEMVKLIASGKAADIASFAGTDDIIIAADTLVYIDGVPLGKPENDEHAKEMLRSLSGRAHEVHTGVAVFRSGKKVVQSECTKVYFRKLSDAEIDKYVASGEPMDKAGAYGIQCLGAVLVEKIEGDYFNVVGLPVCRLTGMLSEVGFSVLG